MKNAKRSADSRYSPCVELNPGPSVELRPRSACAVDLLPDGRVVFDWEPDGITLTLSAADARALNVLYLDAVMDGRDYFTKRDEPDIAAWLRSEHPGA